MYVCVVGFPHLADGFAVVGNRSGLAAERTGLESRVVMRRNLGWPLCLLAEWSPLIVAEDDPWSKEKYNKLT